VDRNVVTATILIALIMVVWLTWLTPPVALPDEASDSTRVESVTPPEFEDPEPVDRILEETLQSVEELGMDSTLAGVAEGEIRDIVVRSDLYIARLSTKGATLRSFQLTEYLDAVDSSYVQMVDTTLSGAISLVFTTPGNRVYDTRSFLFTSSAAGGELEVGDQPLVVTLSTDIGAGSLTKTYTFTRGTYEVGLDVSMDRPEEFLTPAGYEILWNGAIPFSELDRKTEAQRSGAFARSGGEVEEVLLVSDAYDEQSIRGDVDWIAVKNKYFASVIMPDKPARGAELIGERFGESDSPEVRHVFSAGMALARPVETDAFRLYLGPIEISRFARYDGDLYDMVDYGWDFFEAVTRPLARYVFVPTFDFLATILPNYGLVIIVFSILVKALLYPLTKKSFTSMAKMRELQPRMEAIKAKYSDSPQKQQQAMMKMYKETGVNPVGGCLPMLLQYPIIIALWQFLPQAIELRQQGFLWAADLSAADVLVRLPFDIPLYGDYVSGFTALMGLSMIVQMRLQASPSANPQAKMFTYLMPVMIFVIFNRLAAGLNLYYLCYNVLSAAQQKVINRNLHQHPEMMKAPASTKKKSAGGGKGSGKKKSRR
jgi:YidC/Oxa1 family membrane protein insertase